MRLEGAKEFAEALRSLRTLAVEAPRIFADLVFQEATRIVPKRSGRLAGSICIRRTRLGYEVAMGGNRAPYAPYIEFGAGRHAIRPRRARALRFEIRGEIVYARYVVHPGIRPLKIMGRAVSAASREFEERLGRIAFKGMRKIL